MNIYIANSYKDYIDFTAKHILHFLEKKQEKKEKLYISVSSEYDTKDIYDSIIKDIVKRFHIKDIDLLNRIVTYILTTPSQTFSLESLKKYFESISRGVS